MNVHTNYHSHFGVYGLALDETHHKILLIEKARGPYTRRYDLPGGSLEEGELLEDALCREIMEETSCRVHSARQLVTLDVLFPYRDPETGAAKTLRHIGVIYQVKLEGTPTADGDGQDSRGAAWINRSDLHENNTAPFVLRALAQI